MGFKFLRISPAIASYNTVWGLTCKGEDNMTRRKTNDEFVREVYNLVGDEYTPLTEYEKSSKHVIMKHNLCGNEYPVTPNHFTVNGRRCPECADNGATRRKTVEQFKKNIEDLVGNEYELLSTSYKNNHTNVMMKHKLCSHEYPVSPHNFLAGNRCPECANKTRWQKQKMSHEEFVSRLYDVVGDKYEAISEYDGYNTHLMIRHNECGHEYPVQPANILYGKGCPACNQSKGEELINSLLEDSGVDYNREHKFEGCKHRRELPFDFVIFENGLPILAIEYDGMQHFRPMGVWGGEEKLKRTQICDKIKNEFCENNDIPLVRIPYTYNEEQVKETVLRLL